jgi:hypothetical protein
VSPLFRRNSAEAPAEPEADSAVASDGPLSRSETAKKGRPTPKRTAVKRVVEPPPKDNKEARKRLQQKMREERAERWEGAKRGEEKYLLPRDRGPVRRLVRDIVDSRRNVGPFFFGAVIVVIALTMVRITAVYLAATALFYGLFFVLLVDIFLMSRVIRKAVRDRFPDSKERLGSLYLYAAMRSISFRRLRNPKPQVKPGDAI